MALEHGYNDERFDADAMLGARVHPRDPDRAIIEPWAQQITGPILDAGSGTGRWTARLHELGHEVVGLEPAQALVARAERDHPDATFRVGAIEDLGSDEQFGGILAWYTVIHTHPDDLPAELLRLRMALAEHGSLLLSWFAAPEEVGAQEIAHPVQTAYAVPVLTMVAMLDNAGFKVQDVHHSAPQPHAVVLANVRTAVDE